MDKRKVGILTFSDGRDFAHKLQYDMNKSLQDRLVNTLAQTGEIEPVPCELVWTTELARSEGRKLRDAGVECTILNYAIWAFPHFTSIATESAPGPFLCFSNINPQYPGLVAMLAAAGSLNQIGVFHSRISGDIEDKATLEKVMQFVRGASAVARLKGETEMANNFATMDLAEAFLNDPYDWDGPHERIVCATEADSDAALTMEIFKHIAQTPVLFADVRHYDAEYDFWDLVNSGQHATYFAGKSFKPEENMPHVKLLPEIFYFPAGGASVFHIAQPGEVTLGRLTRKDGNYWMAILPAEFVELPPEVAERKAAATTPEWPHAFARLKVSPETFVETYSSNHIHGVYGNYVEDLIWACKILGIDYRVYA